MYQVYVENYNEDGKYLVKKWCYRIVFNEEFNISIRSPFLDTCSMCDWLQSEINFSLESTKDAATVQEQVHLRIAELVKETFKCDVVMCKQETRKHYIVFYLEK